MDRRSFLKLAAALPLLGLPELGAAAARPGRRIASVPASREFVVLGRSHLFAVHRVQYEPGHNFQIALRLGMPARISGRGPRPWRRWRRRDESALLRTEVMDLRSLRPGKQPARSLHGVLVGLDGRELLPASDWPVRAVHVYAEVDPEQTRPDQLEYFLFGHLQDWYGLHVIGGTPDFEQIIRLGRLPEDQRLRLPLANTAVNARRNASGTREMHFASLPQWRT